MEERVGRMWVLIALPIVVGIFYVIASAHFGYTTDDTYIYLQFAKNLIRGDGMSFNAGQPTYGFTSPLWLLIISLGGKLGVDVYIAAKGIDLVFASCSVIIFYFLAIELIRDITVALLSTAAFSLNVWLIRWAGTGMETSLSVCLVLGTVLYCLRNEYLLSMVLAGFLTLVRPEACLIAVLIMIDIYLNSIEKMLAVKTMFKSLFGYAIVVIPWLLYAYTTFGTLVPNTARAKSDPHAGIMDIIMSTWNQVKIIGLSDGFAAVILVVSTLFLIRSMKQERMKEFRFAIVRQSFVAGVWIILLPIIYLLSGITVVSRYLLLATPFIGLLGIAHLFHYLRSSRFTRHSYSAVIVCAMLFIVQSQIAYWTIVKPGIDGFETGVESCLIPIGTWLKENASPEEKIFVWDIGVLGYYSDRTMVDGFGLASPEMIPLIRAGYTPHRMMSEKTYSTVANASYVVHRSAVPEEWKSPDLVPILTKTFLQLGLETKEPRYYTLYKVHHPIHQ